MKHEIGDVVIVRDDLISDEGYGDEIFIGDGMGAFRGKEVTIAEVDNDDAYLINDDDMEWYWTDEMFEGGC